MKKLIVSIGIVVLSSLPALAQQPLSNAQQNYKRCPNEAMKKGEELVTPICGAISKSPLFPSYDDAWGRITPTELQMHRTELRAFSRKVDDYMSCITTRVIGGSSFDTSTLDYAACAHQSAGEALTEASFSWSQSCMALKDTHGKSSYAESCFPSKN